MTEQQLAERLKPVFEHLHHHPEISWEEKETTGYLADFLKKEGLKPKTFDHMTGLYVDIGPGEPEVGFRTDIDALWQEVDGQWRANHSCGHDAHMTVALGVVLLLKEMEAHLPGAVRILFQPAEEKGEGAKAFVKAGVVDNLEYLFGAHIRPHFELKDGTFAAAIRHGAVKLFKGNIHGTEAHGARPEQGVNAIEAAAAIVDGLKRIWIDPNRTGSIKMTQLHAGGQSSNIIPATATFSIDARAQDNETMEALTTGFKKVVESVETLYGADIDWETAAYVAAAEVDSSAREILKRAIIDVAGEENFAEDIVTPGGEDFHFYALFRPRLKTTMLGIGCGATPGLHHPHMTFNWERVPTAARIIARALVLALKAVRQLRVVAGNDAQGRAVTGDGRGDGR